MLTKSLPKLWNMYTLPGHKILLRLQSWLHWCDLPNWHWWMRRYTVSQWSHMRRFDWWIRLSMSRELHWRYMPRKWVMLCTRISWLKWKIKTVIFVHCTEHILSILWFQSREDVIFKITFAIGLRLHQLIIGQGIQAKDPIHLHRVPRRITRMEIVSISLCCRTFTQSHCEAQPVYTL